MKPLKPYINANKNIHAPEELKQRTIELMKSAESENSAQLKDFSALNDGKVISLSRHRRQLAMCVAATLLVTLALSRLTTFFAAEPLSIRSELKAGQTEEHVELSGDTLFFNDITESLNLIPHLGASGSSLSLIPLRGELDELAEVKGLESSTVSGCKVYIDYTASKTQATYRAYFEKNKKTYMLMTSSMTQEEFIEAMLSVLQ